MLNRPIVPVLIGRGMAGQAILKSLAVVALTDPELNLLPVRQLRRGDPISSMLSDQALNVLFIANPSGLHAQFILAGAAAGVSAIAVDKPVCVRPEEIGQLRGITVPVSVYHGYRVMWGTRTIKAMIDSGELGDVFSFEARYWQSSSAQMALSREPEKRKWKNDPQLNGPSDVLSDLGSHVTDICLHLIPGRPLEAKCWTSFYNSAAPYRDTHVHMLIKFAGDKRAFASISKTLHGATNSFEYTVVGTKAAVTWRFLQPDEIEYGSGNRTTIIRRQTSNPSSSSHPFHGLGWLEGYIEITRQTLRHAAGLDAAPVPTLQESLDAMDLILNGCG